MATNDKILTGRTHRKVTIQVRSVGSNFGCCGEVIYRGRVIAETDVLPHGMRGVAYERAETLVSEL